jgi:CheY-like chemotaxis protein
LSVQLGIVIIAAETRRIEMGDQDKIRVLVAEDEESFLVVLSTVLETTNRFEVYPCESGDEAIEALKRSHFDVVILDHKMPGMTGLNVLQWLHEQKSTVPVIMLTGAGSENIAVEAMKLGAYDYLSKDHFDRGHFPILVSSVYERYLFRKEKEQPGITPHERERYLAFLELLRNSVSSFSEIVQMALTKISFVNDESERALRPLLPPAGKEDLEKFTRTVREELETLAYASKSMIGVPKVTDESYVHIEDIRQSEKVPESSTGATPQKVLQSR